MTRLQQLEEAIRQSFHTWTFENVTALRRRLAVGVEGEVPGINLAALRSGQAAGCGGGVCFEIAPVFLEWMRAEGYDARPVLAQISFPDGHQAAIVTLDGREYLVDVGTGSPVFRPIPLDAETEIAAAGVRYRFRRDANPDFFLQERMVDGEWKTSTRYDLAIQTEERRIAAYQRHHTIGQSWVVDRLRMICWHGDHTCYSMTGAELTTLTEAGKETRTLERVEEFEQVAAELFRVPKLPIRELWAVRPEFFR